MNDIEQNKNGKSLKIYLFTHPDEDDLIKDTFYFLTHPNTPCTSPTTAIRQSKSPAC